MFSSRARLYKIQLENKRRREAQQEFDKLTSKEKIIHFTNEMTLHPNNASLYINRGNAYFAIKMFDEAIADFNKALDIDGTNAITYNNRANVYKAKNMHDKAINDYNNAIFRNPTIPEFFINRGITYYEMNKYKRAIQNFSDAIDLDSSNIKAYYNRGITYQAMGLQAEAISDFNKTLEISPNNPSATNRLAALLQQLNNTASLDNISKNELFSAITKIPDTDNQIELLKQSKEINTVLGIRFWKQEGIKTCSLERGTLKQINDQLKFLNPNSEGEELKQFKK